MEHVEPKKKNNNTAWGNNSESTGEKSKINEI